MNKKKTKKDYTNEEVIAGLQLKDDILFSAVFDDLGAAQELVRTVLDDETKISHLMEMFNDSSKYNEEFKQIAEVTNRIKYIEGGQSIMGKTVFEEWKEQLIEESREEGREEGREFGKQEARIETTIEYYRDGFIPAEKAAEKLGMTVEEFLEKYGK